MMKIFISYGHGDYTEVVDFLFDALIREGHEPWKDDRYEGASGIPAGQDFTQLIYRVIDNSDFVIAFVTKQTKEKPYCCDERQYAYNSKGNRFIQIRMDYVDITLGNAQSYIDMSDVVGGNGQLNLPLFEEKLKALFAAFRDPASFAAGGLTPWAKFETHLKVPGALKYHDFIASLNRENFVGREWLVEKCKSWAMDSTIPCRLFVILGEAGTGKTAFIRRLAEDEELVRSVHICVYDRPSTRTARDTLRDLSYVLAQNNRRYFDFLKTRDFEQLRDMTVDGLFEFLFIEPLKTETQKYLLVIDGLDEMEENAGFKPLMRLFRQYASQINPHISFLVTGRPDPYITDMLRTVAAGNPLESVMLDKHASKEDLQCFIESKLRQLDCYSQGLADKLLDACDGNFEYLSLLFREALDEGLQVFDGMKIPRGLNERYAQYLDRRMDMAACNRLTREQRQLLSVLCAAYEPLPISVLCAVTGLESYDISDELELFGSLIRHVQTAGETARICLFTKSFRDFLLSKQFEKYCADHKLGTRLIAQYLMTSATSEAALQKFPYLDQYGFVHLLHHASEDAEAVVAYCQRLKNDGTDVALRIANALHTGETAVIHGYWQVKKALSLHATVIQQLKARRSADALMQIVAIYRQDGDIRMALTLEADVLQWNPSPEIYRRAESLYREALQLAEQQHEATPTGESRTALSLAYNRLGDLARRKQTPEGDAEAQELYLKMLAIDEQNHEEKPNYASRRSLSVTYNRLGDMAQQKRTPEGDAEAVAWYLKMLTMDQQNYEENPGYESRRDLATAYNRLGDIARQKQTPEGDAETVAWYQKALALYEQNYDANPCYESRRSLSVICTRLGDMARLQQTPEGDTEAEQWYLKTLDIDRQNHDASPGYQSRRDLAIDYNRLGDLARRRQTPEGDAKAVEWYRNALAVYEQNYEVNPGYQSRSDLAVAYSRFGDIARQRNTPEGNTEAVEWYRKSLALYEENHEANPGYQSRRSLSITYTRLGDMARRKKTPEGDAEAEMRYSKTLAIDEQNYEENPGYESRRDLAIDYNRLGDLARQKKTPDGDAEAAVCYQKALALYEQNYEANPGYESRRDLAIAYGRCGDAARQKKTPEGDAEATARYQKALALYEQNHDANPNYESRRDLSTTYNRLGDLARKKQTPEGNAEAEKWYLKMLAIGEQNYEENPGYESRRDLAIDYNRLGDIARQKKTPEGNTEAAAWYQKALTLYEQNHDANPCYESRRALSIVYNCLGDTARQQKTPEGVAEAERWYLKMLAIDEQNYATDPCAQSKNDLSITYARLAAVAREKGTTKGRVEAAEWSAKRTALLAE